MRPGFVPLSEVATISDNARIRLSAVQVASRGGRYRHYDRDLRDAYVEDYTFEGDALLLGAAFNVCTSDHGFTSVRVAGKVSVSPSFHIVVPNDVADLDYLSAVLRYTQASPYLENNPFVDYLLDGKVGDIQVFWPDAECRMAFARLVSMHDGLLSCYRRQSDLLMDIGRAKFSELISGQSHVLVPLKSIAQVKRGRPMSEVCQTPVAGYPYVTPLGEIGLASAPLAGPESLSIGVFKRSLVLRWFQPPSWVGDSLAYVGADGEVGTAYLRFALEGNGGKSQDGMREPVRAAGDLKVPLFARSVCDDFQEQARVLLLEARQLDLGRERLRVLERSLFWAFGEGCYPADRLAHALRDSAHAPAPCA